MAAYSGLWDGVHGEAHSLIVARPPLYRKLAQVLRRRQMTVLREVLDVVAAGASINGAAAVTYTRVAGEVDPGNPAVCGGARTIETVTKIGATSVTDSGDVADVDQLVDWRVYPNAAGEQAYPEDLSGNGGGGALDKPYAVNG